MPKTKTLAKLPLLSLVLMGASGGAYAQATDAGQIASGEIGEIIVTAQRRSESSQKVPIAITALGATQLAASGIRDAKDLAVATPSLQTNDALGYFLPRLRGIGSTSTGPGIESAVASYIDNVYIAASPAAVFSFNNVERIEVLKGPQGTLFGRNATGGLINVITKDPSHVAGGEASISYGNYDIVSGSLYPTSGLTEDMAIDFAATGLHQGDGYGTNLFDGSDANKVDHQFNLRSKLLWTPGDNTEIRLSGDYSENAGNYPGVRDFTSTSPLFGPPTGGSVWDQNVNAANRYEFKGGGVTLRVNQDLGGVSLASITAYRKSKYFTLFDFDMTSTPALSLAQLQRDSQFSQELQLQSDPANTIKWVLGGYYFTAESEFAPSSLIIESALQGPDSPFFPITQIDTTGNQKTQSLAAYAQVTVPLGENTNLTGGLRYTHDERKLVDSDQFGFAGAIPLGSLLPPGDKDQQKNFSKLTWRASIDHSFNPDVMAYASYNRGFKSGGFNPGTPLEPAFLPETIDAFEIGMKATFFNRKVRLNPSLFYYKYSNIQVPFPTAGGALAVINGPSAKVWGLELDGEAAITNALRVTFGATYLHDRFGSFPGALVATPIATGGNVITFGEAAGNRLPFTSDFSSSLGANYRFELANDQEIVLHGDWSYNDGFYTDADNRRRQRAYHTVNASLGWSMNDGQVSVKIWGKNLANEEVLVLQTAAIYGSFASYAPPRTYGVTVGTKF